MRDGTAQGTPTRVTAHATRITVSRLMRYEIPTYMTRDEATAYWCLQRLSAHDDTPVQPDTVL